MQDRGVRTAILTKFSNIATRHTVCIGNILLRIFYEIHFPIFWGGVSRINFCFQNLKMATLKKWSFSWKGPTAMWSRMYVDFNNVCICTLVEECAQKVKIKNSFLKAKSWLSSNFFVFSQFLLVGGGEVQDIKIYYSAGHFFSSSPKPFSHYALN